MNRKWKATAVLVPWAVAVGIAGYYNFIAGTGSGPDFIRAIQNGSVTADAISSIEVVEPAVGYTPFTAKGFDSLTRRATIAPGPSIGRMLSLLTPCQPGYVHQNHPSAPYSAWLKVNTQRGFYLLYCDLEQDEKSTVLMVDANNLNATNPNGGAAYHLESFSDLLSILGRTKTNE